MNLPFSTQLNGKPTYFVEKIWVSLEKRYAEISKEGKRYLMPPEYFECLDKGFKNSNPFNAKLHSMREDKKDRWKPGMIIDFFINNRTKDMFRFAPRIPVISTQKIEITWISNFRNLQPSKLSPKRFNYLEVIIDDRLIEIKEVHELSQNDGFDTIEDFFDFFNEDFKGKIIHWTDKRY
ncbi:MAG: hypothetical protein K2P85_13480 [Flavobacteriaceae bacterium]|nr:hypothetical protein [Flavobacteriaceae bacterium]